MHSVSVIDEDVHIFGGLVSDDTLAGREMHILKLSNAGSHETQYRCIPALSADDALPAPRAAHSACVADKKIVMFGGYGSAEKKEPIEEHGRVWVFSPQTLEWSHLDPVDGKFPHCHSHAAVISGNTLIVHGGKSGRMSTSDSSSTWAFDMSLQSWNELPEIHDAAGATLTSSNSFPNLAIAHEKLYLISASSNLNGCIHVLDLALEAPKAWTTLEFPTNPLTPGPRLRKAAGLHPISTGYGRTYLLLIFGAKTEPGETEVRQDDTPEFWSDIWTLQLPSTSVTPAKAKDATRESIGVDSGEAKWAEVEITSHGETKLAEGKSHPGPRAYFGSAPVDGKKVLIWGGLNARGEPEGDGWTIALKF